MRSIWRGWLEGSNDFSRQKKMGAFFGSLMPRNEAGMTHVETVGINS